MIFDFSINFVQRLIRNLKRCSINYDRNEKSKVVTQLDESLYALILFSGITLCFFRFSFSSCKKLQQCDDSGYTSFLAGSNVRYLKYIYVCIL